jgi:hypothetical protein
MEGEEEEGRGREGRFMNKSTEYASSSSLVKPPPPLLSPHKQSPPLLFPMFPLVVALSLAQWKTSLSAYQVL